MSLIYDSMTPRGHRRRIAALPQWIKPQARALTSSCPPSSWAPFHARLYDSPLRAGCDTPNAPALLQRRWNKPNRGRRAQARRFTGLDALELMNVLARDISNVAAANSDISKLTIGEARQLGIGAFVFAPFFPVGNRLRCKCTQSASQAQLGGGVMDKSQFGLPCLWPGPISPPFSNLFLGVREIKDSICHKQPPSRFKPLCAQRIG